MTETALSTLLTNIGSVATAVIGWMGQVTTFITSKPLVLIPIVAFFFVGGAVGLVNRLIRG